MLTLAGEKDAQPRADAIFAMEKRIAEVQWTREDSGDATKTYNKMTLAQLDGITPGLKISPMLTKVSPRITEVIVNQPSALTGIAKIYADTDLATLKDQMIVNSLAAYSNVLPDKVSDTTFAFSVPFCKAPRSESPAGNAASALPKERWAKKSAKPMPLNISLWKPRLRWTFSSKMCLPRWAGGSTG